MLSSIDEIITDLENNDNALLNARLSDLASINREDLAEFKQMWPTIETEKRLRIISRLLELAEDNFELVFDGIFKNCLDDPDPDVRSKAIEGLWENDEPSLINLFLNLLNHDASYKVQTAAATALGRFATLAEHQKLHTGYASKIYQALLSTIKDNNRPVEVRRRALEAIAPMSSPEVERVIGKAYQSDDTRLKISAIYAMGKSCNPAWLPILLEELNSPDAGIRYEAAGACGELGEEETVAHLCELVEDRDIEVQMVTIRALSKIGGTEAKNCLEQCLDDGNEVIQQAAEQALSDLNEGEEPLPFSL